MRNEANWVPSKYKIKRGYLKANPSTKEVGVASRLVVNAIAGFYQKYIPVYVKGRLIDLGCGKVPLFGMYKEYAKTITCVDWVNSVHQNPYTDFEQDLNQPLQFENGSFDTVILSDVLEHIRRPEQLIQEIFRILDHNGILLMNVPFYYWLHEVPFDYFRYTRYALQSMSEDQGFEIIHLEAYGGAPEILTDISSKLAAKIPVIGMPIASCMQWFAGLMLLSGLGRKLSAKTGKQFPLGYTMIARKP
ncbi:MAG: class I SAM-dependent methyltransferase [Saprospiraceae bacterium]|nr:class I SAM-dependent methyltransferase [Saprospiraceae bacterium]